MMSRVRVYIGNAEVFEGVIQSISVNNLIVNKDLVPMVTTLSLDIQRYPGFAVEPAKTPAGKKPSAKKHAGKGKSRTGGTR